MIICYIQYVCYSIIKCQYNKSEQHQVTEIHYHK